jgi:hypothetical protein
MRYIVSISNKFITWDLSTSDLTRDVNPGIEGIMQQLVLSPDNRFAATYTNNNQTVLLNTLTSEYVVLDNPLPDDQPVSGVFLLNTHLFVYGPASWCRQVSHYQGFMARSALLKFFMLESLGVNKIYILGDSRYSQI